MGLVNAEHVVLGAAGAIGVAKDFALRPLAAQAGGLLSGEEAEGGLHQDIRDDCTIDHPRVRGEQ
ncbi:hypothetical protein OG257_34165 [Streptomyces sp. NBC_00683]|uniref:hypothetical protein n=1 Tax=Streptomyces sp. NBC_00683 TaxID=2903670 RepID=UPI002E36DCD1|nr:hypothetical protein [Streptomyces sp. NBC_00683]